ncbi:MAG: hypothetical protein ACI8P9_002545 [Parasphingorhabdus sp.]|jgi:uncharacterized protein (TIGR00369 family)
MTEAQIYKPEHLGGLEYLEMVLRGELPMPPMAKVIPMQFVSVAEGFVVMSAVADVSHTNTIGGVHGGFAATLLDSVTGCTVHSMLEAGISYTTIGLELKMLRPPPLNETMIMEGRIVNISKRLAVANGVVKNQQGKLVAEGSSTCMIFR